MKTVLLICYAFPPFAADGGGMIAAQTAKYLPRFGWRPIVLTIRDSYHPSWHRDEALLDDLPKDTRIVRTRTVVIPHRRRARSRRAGGEHSSQTRRTNLRSPVAALMSLIRKVGSVLVNPDPYLLWIPFAVYRGARLIRQERVDAIVASSTPPSTLLVGYLLKLLTGKPLVGEIGDHWATGDHHDWETRLQRRIQRWQEAAVVRQADVITTCFDSAAYQEAYPEHRHKFRLMMLGYDRDDLPKPGAQPEPRADPDASRFEIMYVGKLGGEQYPYEPLLDAVAAARIPGLHLTLIGPAIPEVGESIRRLGLQDAVSLGGFMGHAAAVRRLRGADGLLLIINDTRESYDANYSIKLFEYLAAQKPILALVPRGGKAAELVERTGSGVVCSPRDRAEIVAGLRAVRAMRVRRTDAAAAVVRQFDKEIVVGALARILDGLVATPAGGPAAQ